MAAPLVLGIDGGGTSCRAALLIEGRRIEVTGGPANIAAFDRTMAVLNTALHDLAERAGLPPEQIFGARAHVGLAGILKQEEADQVAAALPLRDVVVTDDQPTLITGALGLSDGSVAGIGTGSFLGRRSRGQITLIGGWGFQVGDQASGAWLGRRLLTEALLSVDGLREPSPLSEACVGELGQAAGIVRFSLAAIPAEFGAFAPRIVEAAQNGDAIARSLMEEGAAYILRGLDALGHEAGSPLCLAGGLGPRYADYLPPEIAAGLIGAKASALDGALALAAERGDRG